jgi:beta-N-acetylhexosaminidase
MKAGYLKLLSMTGLALLLLAVAVGCSGAAGPPETETDFTGFITEIYPGDPGQILAEFDNGEWVDKYVVTIKDDTEIFRQVGEDYLEADFGALETGQAVEIWFSGPVKESFPMQVDAAQVVILE